MQPRFLIASALFHLAVILLIWWRPDIAFTRPPPPPAVIDVVYLPPDPPKPSPPEPKPEPAKENPVPPPPPLEKFAPVPAPAIGKVTNVPPQTELKSAKPPAAPVPAPKASPDGLQQPARQTPTPDVAPPNQRSTISSGDPTHPFTQTERSFILGQIMQNWVFKGDPHGLKFKAYTFSLPLYQDGTFGPKYRSPEAWDPRRMISDYDEMLRRGMFDDVLALESLLRALHFSAPLQLPPTMTGPWPQNLVMSFDPQDVLANR